MVRHQRLMPTSTEKPALSFHYYWDQIIQEIRSNYREHKWLTLSLSSLPFVFHADRYDDSRKPALSVFWVCYPSWILAKTNDCNNLIHVQITCLFKWPQNACVFCRFELSSLHHVLCICITYASVWKIRFCRSQAKHLTDDMSPTHTFFILHVGRGIWVHTPTNTKITHILPSTIKN